MVDEDTEESGAERPFRRIIVTCVVLFLITCAVASNFHIISVPSGSMQNTIPSQSRIITFSAPFGLSKGMSAQIGNVVVFSEPAWSKMAERPTATQYVKRILAVEGDVIGGCDDRGRLVRNGEPIDEEYLKDSGESGCDFGPFTVPQGRFFAMGDNRLHSRDTRWFAWQYAGTPSAQDYYPRIEDIAGRMLFRSPA